MNELLRVYPQGPVTPISSTLRKDVETADALLRGGVDAPPTVAAIGDTIPLVFCQRSGSNGGVFLAPPLVRIGCSNTCTAITFRQAVVLSDGELPSVPATDIWQGTTRFSSISGQVTATAYSSLPSYGDFAWSISVNQLTKQSTYQHPEQIVSTGIPAVSLNGGYVSGNVEVDITAISEYATSLAVAVSKVKHEVSFRGVTRWFRGHQKYEKEDVTLPVATQTSERLKFPNTFNQLQDIKVKFKDFYNADKEDYVNVTKTTVTAGKVTTTTVAAKDDRGQLIPIYEYEPATVKSKKLLTASWNIIRTSSNPIRYNVSCSGMFTTTVPEFSTEQEVVDQYKISATETRTIPCPLPDQPAFTGSGGSFSGMTVLAVKGAWPSDTNKHLRKIDVFIRNGLVVDRLLGGRGSSNLFPDLAYYLMYHSARVPSLLIDSSSLASAAQFTSAQGLFFNGVLASPVNLREYLTRVSPFFLLRLTQFGGKFGLRPVLPTSGTSIHTGAISPICTYDDTTIAGGSLSVKYVELGQRKPFCALMVWRDQPEDGAGIIRNTEVRYSGTALDGPFEQYDLSDFCTSEAHAQKVGRYILSQRRHVTHTVVFRADPTVAQPTPGDIVRVVLRNAASEGGNLGVDRLYQVERIAEDAAGLLQITASHFPVDGAGRSLIALDVAGSI